MKQDLVYSLGEYLLRRIEISNATPTVRKVMEGNSAWKPGERRVNRPRLTTVMILLFLGNGRGTFAVMLSIPLSALAGFILLHMMGYTINTMVLGGLALAFSRLIDDSVVVLENIFRHLEMGETPEIAAERGGMEVSLPVLASTCTTGIVFFPWFFFME